ncbi:MAG: hypothetical protein DRH37_01200 [Deltaproteobacteria bacterium]|nr:MAG: hypothetical protein DRH37_01200 [Deltaproteobacteria bacterium]
MPRLSIDISEEKSRAIDKILKHGMRVVIFNLLIDDLLKNCKEHGAGKIIGALVERDIGIKELSNIDI